MKNRWNNLRMKSGFLMDELKARNIEGRNHLKNRKVLQWSILQHYEAALTPLTDVTQSIRVAGSFAQLNNKCTTAVCPTQCNAPTEIGKNGTI